MVKGIVLQVLARYRDMAVSKNRGTPLHTPKYYSPYSGDKVSLVWGNPEPDASLHNPKP